MLNAKSGKLRTFVFFAILAATIFLSACYPVTRSKGKVVDAQGLPVAEATVRIGGKSAKPKELKTNADGTFDFGEIELVSHQEPIEIELSAEKAGFIKTTKKVAFDSENNEEIVLQK